MVDMGPICSQCRVNMDYRKGSKDYSTRYIVNLLMVLSLASSLLWCPMLAVAAILFFVGLMIPAKTKQALWVCPQCRGAQLAPD